MSTSFISEYNLFVHQCTYAHSFQTWSLPLPVSRYPSSPITPPARPCPTAMWSDLRLSAPRSSENLYTWKRNAFAWFPGSKVRLFDRGNPAAILSHYSDMDRKGILRTKTPLLVAELRGDRPVPYDTTAGACATYKASKKKGKLRTREAWGRELRWRAFKLLYCIRPW